MCRYYALCTHTKSFFLSCIHDCTCVGPIPKFPVLHVKKVGGANVGMGMGLGTRLSIHVHVCCVTLRHSHKVLLNVMQSAGQ